MKHRFILSCLIALITLGLVAPAMPIASATVSNPKLFVSADNTFYAFVRGGEKITANFTRSDQRELLGLPAEDITVMLDGPGLAEQRCVLQKTVAVGRGCGFSNVIAPETGVYRVDFRLPQTAKIYDQVSPTVRWGGNMFSWNITVSDETGPKQGRLWSELYAIRQPIDIEYLANLSYFYVSESGYLYRANYKGYNGQISTLSADAVGIRTGDQCESAYQSIGVTDEKMSPSFGTCGGSYKLYFEQPAGDLPKTAKRWDGKTEWVSPPISRPIVSNLRFESDKTGDKQSGKIKFTLKNFVGQYKVKIDVNSDGNYDTRDDVSFARVAKKLGGGEQTVWFKGEDRGGTPIPSSQRIGIKVEIAKVAEIHLVNADVEGRTGGLELIRMSGENAPSSRLCWNDKELSAVADLALAVDERDGRNCPDSSGGAHGWQYGTGAWGDMRYIDDWAYATSSIDGTSEIHYPEESAAAIAARNGNQGGIIALGVGLLTIGGIIATIVVITVRRNRRLRELKAAELRRAPAIFPGPGDPRQQ